MASRDDELIIVANLSAHPIDIVDEVVGLRMCGIDPRVNIAASSRPRAYWQLWLIDVPASSSGSTAHHIDWRLVFVREGLQFSAFGCRQLSYLRQEGNAQNPHAQPTQQCYPS